MTMSWLIYFKNKLLSGVFERETSMYSTERYMEINLVMKMQEIQGLIKIFD